MRTWLGLGAAVALAAAGVSLGGRLDAAKAKADLDVTFGPVVADARASATFVLSLRNRGSAAATLALGDRIEVLYASGDTAAALAAAGADLAAQALPAGIVEQSMTDNGGAAIGTRLAVAAPVSIPAGSSLVVEFATTTAAPGAAPVVVDLALSKSAGRFPRRVEARVVKAPRRGDTFFGDGADGPLTITADASLEPLASYTDVFVAAGATVTVPSGATIRCTGDFENRGTIVVLPGGRGGGSLTRVAAGQTYDPLKEFEPEVVEIGRGDALAAPRRPSVMTFQASVNGTGGTGLGTRVFGLPLSQYREGGGGGSGAYGAVGGDGGGLLRVLAGGEVRNGGTIVAAGAAPSVSRAGVAGGGAGGGAGGIVILAAGGRVRNDVPANANGAAATGTIDVRGGSGGPSDGRGGGGGGGGGGLVVFAAPQTGPNGTVQLDGGAFPATTGVVAQATWAAGGGGGACAGDGGDGLSVSDTGVVVALPDGQAGFVLPRLAGAGQLVVRENDPRTIW